MAKIRLAFGNHIRSALRIGAFAGAALLTYQCAKPSSSLDAFIARNVECEYERVSDTPKETVIHEENPKDAANWELDHFFREVFSTGDTLRYGKLELRGRDIRPQSGSFRANTAGDPTMLDLECPGYAKVDVLYNGKSVPGGTGIEIVYAGRLIGSGGLFDGWPNYTLGDILAKTDLSRSESRKMLAEGAETAKKTHAEERRRYQLRSDAARQTNLDAHVAKLAENPALDARVRNCKERFDDQEDGTYTTRVRRGDNLVSISREFNACNGDEAFFPTAYGSLDTLYGQDVRVETDRALERRDNARTWVADPILHVGDRVRVNPRGSYDLAKPTSAQIEQQKL